MRDQNLDQLPNPRWRLLLGLTIGLSLAASSASAATITVGGSGAAAPTLSVGISMAADGDSVLVHPGTYYEIINTTKSLYLIADGTAGSVVLDGNSFGTVLKFTGVTGDIWIEGFQINNGLAPRGAGVQFDNVSGIATFQTCWFYGNIASETGGAIDCTQSDLVFNDCVFESNWTDGGAGDKGGAVAVRDGASALFARCWFRDNQSTLGGAIYASAPVTQIQECNFVNNDAVRGGSLYAINQAGCVIADTVFELSDGDEYGGALFLGGSGIEVMSCTFEANSCGGGTGGAIYFGSGSGAVVSGSVFYGNSATNGGALAGGPAMTHVHHNTFYDNSATGEGAHLYCNKSSPTIEQNIFSDASGAAAVGAASPAAPTFGCNDFWNNGAGDVSDLDDPMGLDGNFSEDPLFCDAPDEEFTIDAASSCNLDNTPSECSGEGHIGAFGPLCGASRVENSTWGGIKARWH